jgi:hypothetical protein
MLLAAMPTGQRLGQNLTHLVESDPAMRSRLGKAKLYGKIVGWPLSAFNPIPADRL